MGFLSFPKRPQWLWAPPSYLFNGYQTKKRPGRDMSVSIHIYTECPRRNVPDFGRVFLMLKYTDITQTTYVQSSMVTEIMAREV